MLPDEVREAVEALCWRADQAGRYVKPTNDEAAATIKAHLLAREAELTELRREMDDYNAIESALEDAVATSNKHRDRAERAEALLRDVVAVAVTQLFDTHRADVEATFSLAELQSMVELTEPLAAANTQVEAIYRKAFDFTAHLSENSRD